MEKKVQFFKECPVCGKKLDSRENTCPHCGFDGLDTLFLSQEDYLNWQETVLNPYKEMIKPPRIFAGYPGVLILMSNGDLYGYGNNDTGAFGEENYGSKLTKPQLVAKNVKSAALGYNYSIYLTKEGKVELLGRSNIPFRERFGEIPDVDEVYAAEYRDVFWVRYKNGEFGVWGDNEYGRLAMPTKLLLGEYERIVEEQNGHDIRPQYTLGRRINDLVQEFSGIFPSIQSIKLEIQKTEEFRMYAEKYSAANIRLVSNKEKYMSEERENVYTREKTSYGDWMVYTKSREVLYKIHMYYENRYLYHPTVVMEGEYFEPELVTSGSGLVPDKFLERCRLWLYGVKIQYFCSSFNHTDPVDYIACLSEDGKLEVRHYRGDIYATYEKVMDVSVGNASSYAYILTKDKILYRLSLPDFINAKKLSEAERIDY